MAEFNVSKTFDQLHVTLDGELFASYRFLGARRPYFWPVNAPEGTVIRGAGTGDHPHHMGLYLAYGLHGHNGATNIWSDWDEAPYGPCGAMHHIEFARIAPDGFDERLIYTNGDGEPIAEELRTILFSVDGGIRRIEWTSHILTLGENVLAPFHLSARPATSINENPVVRSSARQDATARGEHPADWMDFSGKVGDGRAGMTVYDDSANPDPQAEFCFPSVLMATHHAPQPFPKEGIVLRFRADVHSGDFLGK